MTGGGSSRDEAIDASSLALRYPIDTAVAGRLWSALFASSWVEEIAR